MGGRGSGGSRVGAGRKPKTALEHAITGYPGHRGKVLTHPSAPPVDTTPPAVESFKTPKGLTRDERKVWRELAPHAFANGTLTRSTSLSFRLLCRNVVLERGLASGEDCGGASHRGMIQRVDAELLRFNLSPCGKPMYRTVPAAPEAPVVNPLNRFLKRR